MKTTKETLAIFDFDCTITTRDTLLPFLFTLSSLCKNILNCITLIPTLTAYKIQCMDNHTAKEKLLMTFLNHYSFPIFETKASDFAKNMIPPLIKPSAIKRIQWHQEKHHRCIIISAGLENYITPWAYSIGITEVLATRITVENNNLSGKMLGKNCYGPEKVSRLEKLLDQNIQAIKENYTLFAYGDSRGDQELLATADFPFYQTMPAG